MKYHLILFLLIGIVLNIYAQGSSPDWTDYEKRHSIFPENSFLVGFSAEINENGQNIDELLKMLQGFARTHLVESITVTIKSVATLNVSNMDEITHQSFKQKSVSYSNIKVLGLKSETYYDKKKKTAYAIAYAKKTDMIKSYQFEINKHKSAISRKIVAAVKFNNKGNQQNALKNYYEAMPLFREIESRQTIIIALDPNTSSGMNTITNDIDGYKTKVVEGIASLQKNKNLSMGDLAYLMAQGYKLQIGKDKNIRLANFTYQESKMASPFSKRWTSIFEQKLIDVGNYAVATSGSVKGQKNLLVLTGTYWEDSEQLKLITILRDVNSGKALASMEGTLSLSWLKERKISFKPQNFENAYTILKTFTKDEIKGGGLLAEVWTNKGDDNIIFSESERMKLYVRVNKACYIRFIYHQADGTQVLLIDNYYIDNLKVNKVYELPDEFECTEPFGIETLQLNAQTNQFPSLQIKEKYGYVFIQEGLKSVLTKTRGFKKVNDKVLKTEKRVLFTTLSN